MKYIVITAKHHDGFAMFNSDANKFNIVDATPFKRDPLKELAIACHKQGIKLGFYYSQDQDWTAPGGAALRGGHWDKAQDGRFRRVRPHQGDSAAQRTADQLSSLKMRQLRSGSIRR